MTGFLGKLPTVGDFVSRGVPTVLETTWMDLTDSAFALGARRGGADWYETCQDAAPLCFALAPGALGTAAWIGLLRPSLDSFGRSYPFTVLAQVPEGVPLLAVPTRLARWFARVDIAVLSAMEGSLTVDRLGAVLAEIGATPPQPGPPSQPVRLQFGRESVQGWRGPVGLGDDAGTIAWYEMLLSEILCEEATPTLWWQLAAGGASTPSALLRTMPDASAFRSFLAGEWPRNDSPAATDAAEGPA